MLCLAGCGTPAPRPVDLSSGPRKYTSEDYGRVLNRWTRHVRLQKTTDRVAPFATALDVNATFESWDWRWAYVERLAEYYKLSETEKQRRRDEQLKEADQYHDFHVAASASRYEWTEFTSTKPAAQLWRIVLFDDRGREVEPIEKVAIKMPLIEEVAFYPYVGGFDQAFLARVRFRFPARFPDGSPTLSPDAKQVTLRFTGPLGTVDLVWRTVLAEKRSGA